VLINLLDKKKIFSLALKTSEIFWSLYLTFPCLCQGS